MVTSNPNKKTSYVSGVTILGTVSEIYNFGTQYWMIIVSIVLMAIAVSKVYLPVFAALRVGSSYEVSLILVNLISVSSRIMIVA